MQLSGDEARHFLIAAVLLAVSIWPIGFDLGTHGTIFFDNLLQIWAVSVTALLAGLVVDRLVADGMRDGKPVPASARILSTGDALLLTLPSLWLASEALFVIAQGNPVLKWLNVLLMGLTAFFSVPHVIRIVMRIAMPQVLDLHSRRLNLALFVLAVAIAVTAMLLGKRNDLILTCQDFKVAGYDLPQNCRHADGNQIGPL